MYSNVDNIHAGEENVATSSSIVLDKIKSNLQSFINEQNAEVILEEDFNVPMTRGHLELLLQNLIQNGIKYNHSKRKKIIIRRVGDESESMMSFEVKDNGVGIAREYDESVFGMFSRLYSNDEFEGTGIGLAVCQKIAFLYQGSIKIHSEPSKGSSFILSFPRLGKANHVISPSSMTHTHS